MSLISSDRVRAVVGLGVSGLSCARFLHEKGIDFYVVDSRQTPPGLEEIRSLCPQEKIHLGSLDALLTLPVNELYVSPGIPLSHPVLVTLREQGVELRGDVDLFCDYADAPIVAITGSNAKSTVTTLVGELLQAAGYQVGAGGNLGIPALDLLKPNQDYYVLELSSFQLETTSALRAQVACILNVSEDHMDRYDSLYHYQRTKQRIYRGCHSAVCNKQDILTAPLLPEGTPLAAFTTGSPDLREFGLLAEEDGYWLCRGVKKIIHSRELALAGKHNFANVLAAFAILHQLQVDLEDSRVLQAARDFKGLAHRCEMVRSHQGVTYINDSKGTNVGATVAAIEGFGTNGKSLILIAGGDGKQADFSPLKKWVAKYVKAIFLFGKDAAGLQEVLHSEAPCQLFDTLDDIVAAVANQSHEGDVVLFSPACASLDMYSNYQERGRHFVSLVEAL